MLDRKNLYINGKWVAPRNTKDIEVINPSTEKSCAVISLGGKDDVNAAVTAASTSSFPPSEITAQLFSVEGLITSMSFVFFGATHFPLI